MVLMMKMAWIFLVLFLCGAGVAPVGLYAQNAPSVPLSAPVTAVTTTNDSLVRDVSVTLPKNPVYIPHAVGQLPQSSGGVPLLGCYGGVIELCGAKIHVDKAGIGFKTVLTLPPPYRRESFTAECLHNGQMGEYKVTDASQVTCKIEGCTDAKVNICGVDVPVAGQLAVGQIVTARVPADSMADKNAFSRPSFTAKCVGAQGGGAGYQLLNRGNVSCNIFPCQDTKVSLCGVQVAVDGGVAMGGRKDMTMPPPFAPDNFTLACVGSYGRAPQYQIFDASAVRCGRM